MSENSISSAQKLEIFLSYASEDHGLAIALQEVLSRHLGTDFANVWIDKQQLRAGFDLGTQLQAQLKKTDVLIIVYTVNQKKATVLRELKWATSWGRKQRQLTGRKLG
jgi:hypothetical protein